MTATQGYLVVLKSPESLDTIRNKRYRGIDRMPYYNLANQNPIPQEIEAMEHYVFGKVRDEGSGLIPSHTSAQELLLRFRNSPRKFELIWCRSVRESKASDDRSVLSPTTSNSLGFDLAGLGGDFWSIVADFPDDPQVVQFWRKLNENGLFSNASDACAYLSEYKRLQLPDHDIAFEVLEIFAC